MTKSLFPPLFFLVVALGGGSCPSARPEDQPANRVPPAVIFPVLCEEFFEETDPTTTSIVVLSETRPIFETFALRVLHGAGELTPAEAEQDDERDERLKDSFQPNRVRVPKSAQECNWLSPKRPDSEYFGTDQLMLELSNVVEDPFAPSGGSRFGVFARLSIGGRFGAGWYWVALNGVPGSWETAAAARLPINDG